MEAETELRRQEQAGRGKPFRAQAGRVFKVRGQGQTGWGQAGWGQDEWAGRQARRTEAGRETARGQAALAAGEDSSST
jgi:hypothetical protein